MVTIIAREGVLSMADLFSYLLPYPASVLRRTLIPNSNFCLSIVGLWSQISTSFLNVCLDSHMVLQQLLFQPNWERRSKIWCQYISTGIEHLKSIQLTASSWRQIFRSSLLYISYQFEYFNCCEIFVIASFIVQLELLFELCLSRGFTIACMGDFLLIFTLVINQF